MAFIEIKNDLINVEHIVSVKDNDYGRWLVSLSNDTSIVIQDAERDRLRATLLGKDPPASAEQEAAFRDDIAKKRAAKTTKDGKIPLELPPAVAA